jgi:serine/threonine-protein kinase HipA
MEDFCALLGLHPAQMYETTWERIAQAVRDHVPGNRQYETFQHLAAILLLTYALRNTCCHAKNIALLYTSRAEVHLSPAYDFLITSVYAGCQNNPPGISFGGRKTWMPGKNLSKFIAATFGRYEPPMTGRSRLSRLENERPNTLLSRQSHAGRPIL